MTQKKINLKAEVRSCPAVKKPPLLRARNLRFASEIALKDYGNARIRGQTKVTLERTNAVGTRI